MISPPPKPTLSDTLCPCTTLFRSQRGLGSRVRVEVVDNLALDLGFAGDQSLGSLASAMLGVDARPAVAVLAATLLLLWVFAAADYRRRLGHIATALVIGCGLALGWVVKIGRASCRERACQSV